MTARRDGDPTTEGEYRIGWRMGGLAMEVAAQAAAGALLGWLYDHWRGSGQTGILVGSLVGITVGLYSLIRGALKLNRLLDRQYPTRGRGTPPPDDEDDKWDDWEDEDDEETA